MKLDDLLPAHAPGVLDRPTEAVEVADLAYDSRKAGPGTLFFCVPGTRADGHDFAEQALAAGAAALVVERPLRLGVPEVRVRSVREAMALAAARLYGDPTGALRVIGVTGTNGKTTTAFMLRALLEACGERCGLLGTVKSIVGGVERPAERTTPEAIDLQGDFAAMLAGGERACAMEVSSHALALRRTAGVRFAAAIFTNLTQDHLDFHDTMEEYFQAKRLLFLPPSEMGAPPEIAAINVGDPYGRRLAQELPGAVTFGVDCEAEYAAHDVLVRPSGTSARLLTPHGPHEISLPLPGRFNLANALGALATAHRLGGELDTLLAALAEGVRVPGRFEPVQEGQDFTVLIDYAHTPDSLENVLSAAREIAAGRVLCVFGAGGDRDRGKRPLMGEVGARLADTVLITSDNPRSEDPRSIVEQVLAGAQAAHRPAGAPAVQAEVDRRTAIAQAIELAEPGDVVVIAGKGHEQGQELADGLRIPFDDATVAREELRARRGPGGRRGAGGRRFEAAA